MRCSIPTKIDLCKHVPIQSPFDFLFLHTPELFAIVLFVRQPCLVPPRIKVGQDIGRRNRYRVREPLHPNFGSVLHCQCPHLTPRFPFGFGFFAVLAVASPLLQLFAVAEFARTSERPSSFVLVLPSSREKAANQDGESNWLCVQIATTFLRAAGIPGARSVK